jgi:hypothetical protein
MTDKETMKFTLRVIEQIITTGLDRYTYDSVMCDPRHPINQARHLLQEALTAPKETT